MQRTTPHASSLPVNDIDSATLDFINTAKIVHGVDTYDYSKTIYRDSTTKVSIVCPLHGEFIQNPANHLTGKGCKECGKIRATSKKKKKKEKFISDALRAHQNKYDYKKTTYLSSKDPITIICPRHGEFTQIANNHLSGNGCKKCSGKYKPTTQEFIDMCTKTHNGKYTYEKTVYKNSREKIIVTCPVHGDFTQSPDSHKNGHGCAKCARKHK